MTIQAQIIDLLLELQKKENMALLLITHDLALVAEAAKRILVMYAGQVAEQGPVAEVFAAPQHPYTRALLRTIPKLHGPREAKLEAIEGQPPILTSAPTACPFAPRCAHAFDRCHRENPARRGIDARPLGQGHDVACHWHAPAPHMPDPQEAAHA